MWFTIATSAMCGFHGVRCQSQHSYAWHVWHARNGMSPSPVRVQRDEATGTSGERWGSGLSGRGVGGSCPCVRHSEQHRHPAVDVRPSTKRSSGFGRKERNAWAPAESEGQLEMVVIAGVADRVERQLRIDWRVVGNCRCSAVMTTAAAYRVLVRFVVRVPVSEGEAGRGNPCQSRQQEARDAEDQGTTHPRNVPDVGRARNCPDRCSCQLSGGAARDQTPVVLFVQRTQYAVRNTQYVYFHPIAGITAGNLK